MKFIKKLFGKKNYSLQNFDSIELLRVNDDVKKSILLCHNCYTLILQLAGVSKLSSNGANESEAISYFLGGLQKLMNYHQCELDIECAIAYCVFLAADVKRGNILFCTHNSLMKCALQDEDEITRTLSENILIANQNGWQEMHDILTTKNPKLCPKLRSIFNVGY